jgi:hypothetical protein
VAPLRRNPEDSEVTCRGDMVLVILISVLFSLAELGAKPIGQMVAADSRATSQSDDRGRGPSPIKP